MFGICSSCREVQRFKLSKGDRITWHRCRSCGSPLEGVTRLERVAMEVDPRIMVVEEEDYLKVEAPPGMVFVSSQTHEVVHGFDMGIVLARNDAIKDIRGGFEVCDTEDCDWCNDNKIR